VWGWAVRILLCFGCLGGVEWGYSEYAYFGLKLRVLLGPIQVSGSYAIGGLA